MKEFVPVHTLKGLSSSIYSVAISPDGQTVASGGADSTAFDTIKLWDIHTGELLHTFSGHSSFVRSVAFSPDGKLLASGSEDKTVKIWYVDPEERRLKGELKHIITEHSSS